MTVLICVSYYCLAIIGLFLRRYFSKFIALDFYNNKSLNRKRKYAIIYYYFVLMYSVFMLFLGKKGVLTSMIVFWSVVVIIILYIFSTKLIHLRILQKKIILETNVIF